MDNINTTIERGDLYKIKIHMFVYLKWVVLINVNFISISLKMEGGMNSTLLITFLLWQNTRERQLKEGRVCSHSWLKKGYGPSQWPENEAAGHSGSTVRTQRKDRKWGPGYKISRPVFP